MLDGGGNGTVKLGVQLTLLGDKKLLSGSPHNILWLGIYKGPEK